MLGVACCLLAMSAEAKPWQRLGPRHLDGPRLRRGLPCGAQNRRHIAPSRGLGLQPNRSAQTLAMSQTWMRDALAGITLPAVLPLLGVSHARARALPRLGLGGCC